MLLTMLFTMNTRTCMHNAHINAHIYKHTNVENIYTDVYTNTQAPPHGAIFPKYPEGQD